MNKGFTIVELIAVITILGIIAIITTPAYDTISKSIKESNYNSKMNMIKTQTLNYVEKYMKNDINNTGACFKATDLIKNGIITSDSETEEYIENDVTKKQYTDEDIVKVYYDNNDYKLRAIAINENDFDC